ncbi:MAG: histone deacetylase [Acidimicrobiales bacterium]
MTLVVNEAYDDTGHEDAGHPERPERSTATRAGIEDLHLGSDLVSVVARRPSHAELTRVHAEEYVEHLAVFCYEGGGDLDPDTYATYDSWAIANQAAGAGLAVIEELQRRGDGVGFVVTRPPGHHAERGRAMGFCLFNNIAVAAGALRSQGERVLIVDWDVHHGNGTQQIFWGDDRVLYVSTHQSPLFPGGGRAVEVGGRGAIDRTVNLPLPPGATGDVLRRMFDDVALPVITEFAPTWVLVSAGFDSHRDDPMANLLLTEGDFGALARTVADIAPSPGRLAMFLEGGYNLSALRSSVRSTLESVLGDGEKYHEVTHGETGADLVAHTLRSRAQAIDALRAVDDKDEE